MNPLLQVNESQSSIQRSKFSQENLLEKYNPFIITAKAIFSGLAHPPTGIGKKSQTWSNDQLSHLADWLDPNTSLDSVHKALRTSTPAGKAAGHYHIKLPLLLHISN